uniref:Uncharacterized protein n=1 Tax=Zea mays TaxID=4577 RepID=C4J3D3_MAIZE|nr:unknown [Zea mays]
MRRQIQCQLGPYLWPGNYLGPGNYITYSEFSHDSIPRSATGQVSLEILQLCKNFILWAVDQITHSPYLQCSTSTSALTII